MANIKVSESRVTMASHIARYWTPARMSDAQPIPLRSLPKSALKSLEMSLEQQQGGATRVVAPQLPQGGASRQRAQTTEVPDLSAFPFSCVGKLFMTEGNNDYVGSAWVIGDQAIFSAAHCMFDDNGTFFDNVVFIPQYRSGNAPLGSFAAVRMAVDNRYTTFSNDHLNFDLGIAILDRPIGRLTGTSGFAINPISQIAVGQEVTSVGYPAESPFDGSRMFRSRGAVKRDSASGTTQERYFGAENDMTAGCSGGPWIDDSNIVVGLNSFVFIGESPPIMHSPYFGQGFDDLIEWANENGGGIGGVPSGSSETESPCDCNRIKQELANAVDALNSIINSIP